MAEPRRSHFTTLPCEQRPPAQKPPGGRPADEARPADTGTVRLVLALFEPDDGSFPEFSYSQLLESEISHTKPKVPQSRSEAEREDDEAAAVARKLEAKYGGKSRKRDRLQDLIDIGYGYDDEDSFIDNSEAYDEFVPASITTKFGGFYVNSGLLQFRQASDTETDTEDFTAQEKKHKLNNRQGKPKRKRRRQNEEIKSGLDPQPTTLSDIGPTKWKKKKAAGTLSVTSMLRKFQREKEKERQKVEKANQRAAASAAAAAVFPCLVPVPADAAGGGALGTTDPLLSLIGSTNDHALIQAASAVDFDIDLDSLLDVSEETLLPKAPPPPAETQPAEPAESPNPLTPARQKAHLQQERLQPEAASPPPAVPLLEGLAPGLEDAIHRLLLAAKTSEGESKLKFFTAEVNSILLDIELKCRERGGQVRSKVFAHLSSFLPCSKDTLLKRVKKLLAAHATEAPDAQDPIQKLKEAVSRAMSEQMARYHETCRAHETVKVSKAAESRKDGRAATEDNVEEKHGKRGGPKKLFKWDQEIRQCLCHVLKPRMEKFTKERNGQEMEEHLKTFLDNEVKPLWPKGWMQSRVLMKESRNLLGLLTSLPVKKSRSDKKQSAALQGTQPLKDLQEPDVESSNIPDLPALCAVRSEDATLKPPAAAARRSSASVESRKPLPGAPAPPARSLLDLLADQALAQEPPLPVPQELLTAAVAKFQPSVEQWRFGLDGSSPPLPPPPPQCSPVGFPLTGTCPVVVPQLLQDGNMAMDAMQATSNEDDTAVE
ncbi:LOW QUALITY PROTEIN: ubinuclein-1 [Betta splendens]|uniref:LOW QUALITY PROTEIN: ubinuclein-1 n=1 Tax=Betta splendens TaxID=158456 RepID=A0A8M1HI79_BETSP|nr:LOW QUALITY PROTEIN: ubinuclein-1 [Betta splendens]